MSKLDEFLLNPQVRTCSVTVPGTSRNNNSENRRTIGGRTSDDTCPEVRYSSHHSGRLNGPEAEDYPHTVTEATGEFRQYPYMTAGTQQEFTYCSRGTSSGKQKKVRCTSQPQFRSKNTPATIEADQVLLARQLLATNINSPNLTKISVKSQNCPNPLQQHCPLLMENWRNSICLKIFSKQV